MQGSFKEPDYTHWCSRDNLTTEDASFLLAEIEPVFRDWCGNQNFKTNVERHSNLSNEEKAKIIKYYELIHSWNGMGLASNIPLLKLMDKILETSTSIPESFLMAFRNKFTQLKKYGGANDLEGFDALNKYFGLSQTESEIELLPGMKYNDLPKKIKITIETYYEYWHQLPEDMKRPIKNEDIVPYLKEKGFSQKLAESIFTISSPDNKKHGPREEGKKFIPRSKRK